MSTAGLTLTRAARPQRRRATPVIASTLNSVVGRFDRWATPSVLLTQSRVDDLYSADASDAARAVALHSRDFDAEAGGAIVAGLHHARRLDRWSAPSILLEQATVRDPYAVDVSVSAQGIRAA